VPGDLETGVECLYPGRGVFPIGQETVRPGILRIERWMLLANDVPLCRNPKPAPERFLAGRQRRGRITAL